MAMIPIKDAKNRLTELARRVESGETIVVTRNGRPVLDMVPHQPAGKLDLSAVDRFKKEHRLKEIVASISGEFDEPLVDDFLLRPLPRSK